MLAVAGGKGGVGKTTTALALGCVLARAGDRPLVVDADRDMPDLARRAGLTTDPPGPERRRSPPEPLRGLDALADGTPLPEVAHPAPVDTRVSVLPAGRPGPDDLRAAFGRLDGWPGPVVLDCPAGAGRTAAAPLAAADRTLLVSTGTPQSVRDAVKTAAMARALDASPVGVVLSRRRTPPAGLTDALDCPLRASVSRSDDPHDATVSTFTAADDLSVKITERETDTRRNS